MFAPARSAGFFGSRPFGLDLGPPAWPAAPSFATPIALAHYFAVQRALPEETSDVWLAELTHDWSAPIP